MAELLLDALLDTLKLMPWLLCMHVLIEVFEYHAVSKIKLNKALRGPFAPLIGGVCGILPQCGFGVVAADLYSRRSIRLGTMIAVFIATSDEAIPILLSAPTADSVIKLGVLLGFKFAAALIAGYALDFILRGRELTEIDPSAAVLKGCHHHELGEHTHEHEHGHDEGDCHVADAHTRCARGVRSQARSAERNDGNDNHVFASVEDARQSHAEEHEHAHEKKRFDFKCFVVHPLIHTLTVSGYILGVNLLFAVVLYFVGEDALMRFLQSSRFLQPLFAALVGLIPNCASSVIIAQLFARGGITLGAAFAGLSINAGLGVAVLLKKNRPVSNTLWIIGGLYMFSVVVGMLLSFIPM